LVRPGSNIVGKILSLADLLLLFYNFLVCGFMTVPDVSYKNRQMSAEHSALIRREVRFFPRAACIEDKAQ
jgi:hypothetical protein